jgi:hypothetical protein
LPASVSGAGLGAGLGASSRSASAVRMPTAAAATRISVAIAARGGPARSLGLGEQERLRHLRGHGEHVDQRLGAGGDAGAAAGRHRRAEDRVDRRDVRGGVGVALLGALGQAARDELLDRGRHRRRGAAQHRRQRVAHRRRRPGGVHRQDLELVVRVERRPAADHLVGHHRRRVQVGAAVERVADGLLGRHVDRRAERDAGLGQLDAVVDLAAADDLGDAEVEDLGEVRVAVLGHQVDVLGLDVAVDDAGGVGVAQAAQHVAQDRQRPVRRDRRVGVHQIAERSAVEELHHQEQRAVLELAEIRDVDAVGVIDAPDRDGLALEPAAQLGHRRQGGVEQLDRHRPPDRDVLAPVHHPHAALAEQRVQPVAPVDHRPQPPTVVLRRRRSLDARFGRGHDLTVLSRSARSRPLEGQPALKIRTPRLYRSPPCR